MIEVGVDVPNASLMVIENAERMGLAQLHQLRGRVGRGAQESSCVLLYRAPLSQMARARLAAIRDSNDGFRIARRDLELRGPGELLGRRQTGLAQLRVADLARDADLLDEVRATAAQMLQAMPERVDAAEGALDRRAGAVWPRRVISSSSWHWCRSQACRARRPQRPPEPALTNASPASSAPAAAPAVSSAVPRPGTRGAHGAHRSACRARAGSPVEASHRCNGRNQSSAVTCEVAIACAAARSRWRPRRPRRPSSSIPRAIVCSPAIEPVRLSWPVRRLRDFARLMRLDRPIGIWLLLWPMLWALWIAADGHPQRRLLAIFVAGAVLMRSAGCIINDLADRNIDPHVKRTRSRPLAARASRRPRP